MKKKRLLLVDFFRLKIIDNISFDFDEINFKIWYARRQVASLIEICPFFFTKVYICNLNIQSIIY